MRAKRVILSIVGGGTLLAMSVGLGLAQPGTPASSVSKGPVGAAAPAGDGPIRAQAEPVLEILVPSEESRPDFARDELGDEWDMQNSNDVDYMDHVNNSSFSSSGWYGEVQQGAVANIALFAPGGPGNPAGLNSIDSSKYYYFSYDLYVPSGNPGEDTNHRIIYLTQWSWYGLIPGSQNCSGALPFDGFDGWHTYEYDLRSVLLDGSACGAWNWTGHNVAALLVWPHEQWDHTDSGRGPAYFRYRNISLKGDNRADTAYSIRWCVADGDDDVLTTTLYYDTDTNWANGGRVKIASVVSQPVSSPGPFKVFLPIVMRQGGSSSSGCSLEGARQASYSWDTSELPDGNTYFIWFEVTDNSTTIRQVSPGTAPVTIDH